MPFWESQNLSLKNLARTSRVNSNIFLLYNTCYFSLCSTTSGKKNNRILNLLNRTQASIHSHSHTKEGFINLVRICWMRIMYQVIPGFFRKFFENVNFSKVDIWKYVTFFKPKSESNFVQYQLLEQRIYLTCLIHYV